MLKAFNSLPVAMRATIEELRMEYNHCKIFFPVCTLQMAQPAGW